MIFQNIFKHCFSLTVRASQLRDLFFQNRECIENFSWQFVCSRVEKREKIESKKNRECLEKKFSQKVPLTV